MTVKTTDGERKEEHPPHENFHVPLIDDFTRAVIEGSGPGVGGDVGREVSSVEDGIYR